MNIIYDEIAANRPHLFLWAPVFFALGIGVYFALPVAPPFMAGISALLISISLFYAAYQTRAHVPIMLLCLICGGYVAADFRTHTAHTHFMPRDEQIADFIGTITAIEDTGKDSRITVSDLIIEDTAPEKTPRKIRLRLRNDDGIAIGQHVAGLAKLHKPSAPVLPRGFDFRRHMYFKGIGAVGFVFSDLTVLNCNPIAGCGDSVPLNNKNTKSGSINDITEHIESMRHHIAQTIEAHIAYPAAGVAIALMTGRKTAIDDNTNEAMRGAGLAHMLAISGLHMGLFSGAVFFAVRLILALIPNFALRYPIKKYAALAAMMCAVFYALLAGMNIPTQRALIMVCMAFTAILLDRSPISLRLVAFAALIVLAIFPESLLSASFHMSFAAVVSLVVFYDRIRPLWSTMHRAHGPVKRAALYFAGVSMTTVIASLATAPFALYHFHQVATYSVIANFIAVPILGFTVMPCVILALFLMPFSPLFGDLVAAPLWVIERAIKIIINIADWTTALPHAVSRMSLWPTAAIILIVIGALILYLWRGRLAMLGLLPICMAFIFITLRTAPDILIAPQVDIIGVYTHADKLYLNNTRKNGFTRGIWMEGLGLDKTDKSAAVKWPHERDDDTLFIACDEAACRLSVKGKRVSYIKQNSAKPYECAWADIAIAFAPLYDCAAPIRIDRGRTKRNGAYAVFINGDNIDVQTSNMFVGNRPWTQ